MGSEEVANCDKHGRVTESEARAAWAWVDRTYCPALAWALKFLPDWCTLKPATIHDVFLRDITESGKHVVIAGPREFAKTYMALIAELYDGLHLNRLDQMHVGYDATLAEDKLARIIHELDTNKMLHAAYDIHTARTQRSDHFEVKVGPRQDVISFKARGFGGSIRGLHPHRIVLDDIESSQDSPFVWAKNYEDLHGTILGALARTQDAFSGQLVIVGNYLGEGCTVKRIQETDAAQNPDAWVSRRFSALSKHPTGESADLDGESVWPAFRSTAQLHDIRRQMNAGEAWSFEREYMNQIVSGVDTIWSEEMFARQYTLLPPAHQMISRVYIDSAQKVAEGGDRTAIVTIGKILEGPRIGEYVWIDARIAHLSPDDIAAEALRQFIGSGSRTRPQCDAVCLESKTTKGEDPLAALIRTRGRYENVNIPIRQLVPAEHGDKRQRSLKAVPIGRAGALSLPVNPSRDMIACKNEMLMFTGKSTRGMSAVDDGHDAVVWGLIDLMPVERRPAHGNTAVKFANRTAAVGA